MTSSYIVRVIADVNYPETYTEKHVMKIDVASDKQLGDYALIIARDLITDAMPYPCVEFVKDGEVAVFAGRDGYCLADKALLA
jgi:hypothetical protein